MFNHDWFHGLPFEEQKFEARLRCAANHFSEVPPEQWREHEGMGQLMNDLELRVLLYLRDGFSYEIKQLAETQSKSHLVFECMPVDEHYKVGAFVVSLPYDEIVRVEVFAVHPTEKPEDYPQITGFRGRPDGMDHPYAEAKPGKR